MVNFVLLAGRILLVALLYLFLLAVMRTGIGLVRGQNRGAKTWQLKVENGPQELRRLNLAVAGPVVVGRAPGADILIPTGVVSARHARFSLMGDALMVEDLGSTNGTKLNGHLLAAGQPIACKPGDVVTFGNVDVKVARK